MTTANTVGEIPDVTTSSKSDETMWAMFCHLGGLFGIVFPFGNIIVPLVIWLVHRDKFPLVDDQGKEAVNFQISISIYLIASALMVLIAIGLFLLIALLIFALVVTVSAAILASKGGKYRYPFTIRFIQS
jgi:uncharacterized Tic20 family protein